MEPSTINKSAHVCMVFLSEEDMKKPVTFCDVASRLLDAGVDILGSFVMADLPEGFKETEKEVHEWILARADEILGEMEGIDELRAQSILMEKWLLEEEDPEAMKMAKATMEMAAYMSMLLFDKTAEKYQHIPRELVRGMLRDLLSRVIHVLILNPLGAGVPSVAVMATLKDKFDLRTEGSEVWMRLHQKPMEERWKYVKVPEAEREKLRKISEALHRGESPEEAVALSGMKKGEFLAYKKGQGDDPGQVITEIPEPEKPIVH